MSSSNHVLQYEFFHVGGRKGSASSLDEVMAECADRVADNFLMVATGDDTGPGIKTVIRIYDADEKVTRLAKRVCKDMEVRRELLFRTKSRDCFTEFRIKWLAWRLRRAHERIVGYFIEYLDRSFVSGEWDLMVARETWGHAFRPSKRDEYVDLKNAARSREYWLFVYEPADLFADEHRLVASIMY